jgi:hypothetical protein
VIDVDDAMALGTLKTLKASDRANELLIQSGNQIDDQARSAAPGSAPFLTATGVAANIQSQAMMQKTLAAMIRRSRANCSRQRSPQTPWDSSNQRSAECFGSSKAKVNATTRRCSNLWTETSDVPSS